MWLKGKGRGSKKERVRGFEGERKGVDDDERKEEEEEEEEEGQWKKAMGRRRSRWVRSKVEVEVGSKEEDPGVVIAKGRSEYQDENENEGDQNGCWEDDGHGDRSRW